MRAGSWRYVEEHGVTASRGLAGDEFLLDEQASLPNMFSASLKLYTYRNYSALCGRFQNLESEIDLEACAQKGYGVGRRLTGGGAIVMGEDQLGICLSTHSSRIEFSHVRELYERFSSPIRSALSELGVTANLRAKNDLEVRGRKIAGLGVHISPQGGIQFHCSLLLDLDVPAMLQVLKIPIQKYADRKMIAAVGQRMTTVREESGTPVKMEELMNRVRTSYSDAFGADLEESPFTAMESERIASLERERYRSAEWLHQFSPREDMTGMSLVRTEAGLLRSYIGLSGDAIKSILITGDFLEMPRCFGQLESRLKWSPVDRSRISGVVEQSLLDFPAQGLTADQVTEAIWLAARRAHAAHRYTYKGSCYYPEESHA